MDAFTSGADGRVPVVVAQAAGGDDFVLEWPSDEAAPLHAGCTCCRGRHPLAARLSAAYVAQMRGEMPPFRRVVVRAAPEMAGRLAEILRADVVAHARFRLQDTAPAAAPGATAAMHSDLVPLDAPDMVGVPGGRGSAGENRGDARVPRAGLVSVSSGFGRQDGVRS